MYGVHHKCSRGVLSQKQTAGLSGGAEGCDQGKDAGKEANCAAVPLMVTVFIREQHRQGQVWHVYDIFSFCLFFVHTRRVLAMYMRVYLCWFSNTTHTRIRAPVVWMVAGGAGPRNARCVPVCGYRGPTLRAYPYHTASKTQSLTTSAFLSVSSGMGSQLHPSKHCRGIGASTQCTYSPVYAGTRKGPLSPAGQGHTVDKVADGGLGFV
jgi:hypothetical protein